MAKKRRLLTWTRARRIVALVFLALIVLAATGHARWLVGSTAATRLFETVPFVDPLAALESGLAARHIASDVLLGVALLVGIALLLGPVFCGWVCPLGLLLDLQQAARGVVGRLFHDRRRPRPTPPLRTGAKYVVLGALVGISLVGRLPVFQALSPIHLLVRGVAFGATAGLAVLAVLVVLEWFFPRLWCRALCPLGALYSLLGRFAPLRIRIDPDLAGEVPCRRCTIHCPMGIRVMEDYSLAGRSSVDHPDCNRCGSCLDACPRGVLSLRARDTIPRA